MIVSVRVLAATHQDLAAEIAAGRFREDLYHRLNGMVIQVPPLRDRRSDIPELVQHFLVGFCEESKLSPKAMTPDALDRLMAQGWPGNVRELKHTVQKLAVLVGGEVITARDVEAAVAGSNQHPAAQRVEPVTWREARRQVERGLIVERLAAHGWRVDDTAHALGLDRTYLYKKMKRLGIESGGLDSRLRGNDTTQQVASRNVPIQGGNATPNRTQRSNKTSPRHTTHHKTGKRARRPSSNILLGDDLWALIRPIVQPDSIPRTGGRPRLDDRAALTGILFVLKARIAWESLPPTIGCGSGMTCWRRLREWQRAGVWERIQSVVLDRLDGATQIDWSRVSQDGGTATPSS